MHIYTCIMYVYIYIYIYICVYVYMCIEREGERCGNVV